MMFPLALEQMFDTWRAAAPPAAACVERVRGAKHGDLPEWLSALDGLPASTGPLAPGDVIRVGSASALPCADRQALRDALRGLAPWRKGPFELFGTRIDAEWRSDHKWRRVRPHVDLAGKRVLDVGCGNGYFGWRMLQAGARSVLGIDPSLLFVLQHAAVASHVEGGSGRNLVLPLRLEDLARPLLASRTKFDAVFSMGVIYHRRDPQAHLMQLAGHTVEGGLLVLETLIAGHAFVPEGRYARMRNVWCVPDIDTVDRWLTAAGFTPGTVVDITATTTDEQRATEWMPHQSLADALNPDDPTRTIEGHPAPTRAVILARRAAFPPRKNAVRSSTRPQGESDRKGAPPGRFLVRGSRASHHSPLAGLVGGVEKRSRYLGGGPCTQITPRLVALVCRLSSSLTIILRPPAICSPAATA